MNSQRKRIAEQRRKRKYLADLIQVSTLRKKGEKVFHFSLTLCFLHHTNNHKAKATCEKLFNLHSMLVVLVSLRYPSLIIAFFVTRANLNVSLCVYLCVCKASCILSNFVAIIAKYVENSIYFHVSPVAIVFLRHSTRYVYIRFEREKKRKKFFLENLFHL
jgi:hypothetical protein